MNIHAKHKISLFLHYVSYRYSKYYLFKLQFFFLILHVLSLNHRACLEYIYISIKDRKCSSISAVINKFQRALFANGHFNFPTSSVCNGAECLEHVIHFKPACHFKFIYILYDNFVCVINRTEKSEARPYRKVLICCNDLVWYSSRIIIGYLWERGSILFWSGFTYVEMLN